MVTCRWVTDRLVLYLAGEIDTRLAEKIAAHLVSCKRCTQMAEQLAEASVQMYATFQEPIAIPSTLENRVMQAVRALPTPLPAPVHQSRPRWNVWALPAGAIALAATCGFCGFCLGRTHWSSLPEIDVLALESDHRVTEAAFGSNSINSTNASVLAPLSEVQSRVNFALYQPEANEVCSLKGGRSCQVQGMPVAHLSYNWQGQAVSLFELDAQKISLPQLRQQVFDGHCLMVGERNGYSFAMWCVGKTQCVLMSRTTPQSLLGLASKMIETKAEAK
jgi:anti-sigma factor RsiW